MDPLYGQRTTYTNPKKVENKWILVDARNQTLGRLASKIAIRLMGKHRADYQPGVVNGDQVIVINSNEINVSGNKVDQKLYRWHTGMIGGLKTRNLKTQLEKVPNKVIFDAVKGMVPKNSYGRKVMTRLKIFTDENHGMDAQKPEKVVL